MGNVDCALRQYCVPRTVYAFDIECHAYDTEKSCNEMGHCSWTELDVKQADGKPKVEGACISVAEAECLDGAEMCSEKAQCVYSSFCSDFEQDTNNLCANHLEQYCTDEYPLVSAFVHWLAGHAMLRHNSLIRSLSLYVCLCGCP